MIGLWHPFDLLPAGTWRVLTLAALLILTAFAGFRASGDFKTPLTPFGIIDLEFARTRLRANDIINTWTEQGKRQAFLTHLRWDNLFLVCYSTTLALSVLVAAGVMFRRGTRAYDIVVLLAWAQWVAGLLDLVENIALRRMFDSSAGETLPRIAFVCAAPKFVIALSGTLLALAGFVICAGRHQANP